MELYKFINETSIQKYKGSFVVLNDRIYTNPSDEIIKKAGYKKLKSVRHPKYDVFTEYLQVTYTEKEDLIVPEYSVIKAEI